MADVDDAEDINAVLNDDNLSSPSHNEPGTDARENMYFHDLPDALIVTNIDECIFDDVKCKVRHVVLFCNMLTNVRKQCLSNNVSAKLIGFILVVVSATDTTTGRVSCLHYNIEVRCSCCYINMLLLFNCKCGNGTFKKKNWL